MVQIRQLSLGPLQTNCYLVGCENTFQAAIIDPAWDGKSIVAMADNDGWDISCILLTHTHFDHVGGLMALKEATGAPIYVHPDAIPMLQNTTMSAAFFGMKVDAPPPPDEMLAADQIITVGEIEIHVLYTPGHAPGHVCFYLPEYRVVFDGDLLFQDGIGRHDLPGGNYRELMESINSQLLVLPDETQVFPGHGLATTIEAEKLGNPFLRELLGG
ncbi:MAG: MBL fold metallo-hydrolase [Candidatus Promineifilaceae bacterium]